MSHNNSCFISYSSKDQAFAERLYADLQSNGIRCRYAPHHLRPGTVIIRGIDEAIRTYDKLLLILSKASIESRWVEHEVNRALYKEMERKQDMLFPIRVDNAVLESPVGWAADLRHRHIGDFTHWKHHDDYQQAFTRLLRDLKAEGQKPV
jgi:TIR domain